MKYTLLWLPVDKPLEDGCMIMDIHGSPHPYHAASFHIENYLKKVKVCELFLVSNEFNQQVVIGKPAPEVLKWLKPGESVKAVDCTLWYTNQLGEYAPSVTGPDMPLKGDEFNSHFLRVKCPTCGVLH